MITKDRYIDYIRKYIEENEIDFVEEIISADTATRDTIAEELADTIAAIYPAESNTDEEADTERNNLVAAVYEVLENEHAEELEKGGRLQVIMIAITEDLKEFKKYNKNVWDLAEYLTEYATEEALKEYEKKYNIVNYREEIEKQLDLYSAEDFNESIDELADHIMNHLLNISNNHKIFAGCKANNTFNLEAFERESTRMHATVYNMIYK